MIRIRSVRDKSGERFDQGIRSVSVGRALESLLRYELGFGGVVSKVGRDVSGGVLELVVVTHVFGCVDTTFFSGGFNDGMGDSEMEKLVLAAGLYVFHRGERFDIDMEKLIKNTGGSPLLITACGPRICELFSGVPYARIVAGYVVLGGDEGLCRRFLELSEGDFWASIDLVLSGGDPVEVLGVAV